MDELERARQDLAEAMEEWRRNGTLSDESLQKLTRAQQTLTDATEDHTEATEEATKNLKKFYQKTKDIVAGFGSTAQGLRENRENFEALNPAIRSTGAIITSGGRAIGGGLAEIGEKLAIGGAAFGNLFAILGGAGLNLLGKALEGVSEEAAKAGVAFMEFSTAELNRVTGAYRELGNVGAITAGGMDQLYAASIEAGFSVSQFAGLVSRNAQGLAFATGSATESAKAISEITSAARPFQDQLLALGFGLEQQSQVFSDYIVMSRRLGRQQTRDYATLAEGAAEYAFELDELARLTGMSRQEAQKALEAQMSNVRFRATLAKAEAAGGDTLVKAIRGTAAGVEAFGGRKLAEGFQDAFGGLGTESARQFEIATGGLGRQIVENLRSGAISQDQALQQIQQSIQGRLTSLGGMDFIERVGKIGTVMDPMLLEMIEFSQRAGVTAEDMGKLRQEQEKARTAQGDSTKSVIQALKSLQSIAMTMDQIVKDQVFPNAASAVKTFTNILNVSIKTLAKLLPDSDIAGIEARAEGGPVQKNSAYLVGEEGPELMVPTTHGTVVDASKTDQIIEAYLAQAKNIPNMKSMPYNFRGQSEMFPDPTARGRMPSLRDMVTYFMWEAHGGQGSWFDYTFDKASVSSLGSLIGLGRALDESTSPFALRLLTAGHQGAYNWKDYDLNSDGYMDIIEQGVVRALTSAGPDWYESAIKGNHLYGYKNGGIASGPKSGYSALLHGTEAVVPLPDGKSIPVESNQAELNSQVVQALESMSAILEQVATNTRQGADTSKQLLRVTAS